MTWIYSPPFRSCMYFQCILSPPKGLATWICPNMGTTPIYHGFTRENETIWVHEFFWVPYFQTNPMRICLHVISIISMETIRHFPQVFLSYDKLLGFGWSIHICFHLCLSGRKITLFSYRKPSTSIKADPMIIPIYGCYIFSFFPFLFFRKPPLVNKLVIVFTWFSPWNSDEQKPRRWVTPIITIIIILMIVKVIPK